MENRSTPEGEIEMVVGEEPVLAHLSLDAATDHLTVIEFGRVWDGQPKRQVLGLEEDDGIGFLLEAPEPRSPVVGFWIDAPHDFDPDEFDGEPIWDGPRFTVPVLGLVGASVGEIVLVVQARYRPDEPTADAAFFQLAVSAGSEEDDLDNAEGFWRMALEAGDMKAHFGLGYTLCDLGRHREAYDHLRIYTELTPHNAWAWCWLGRACEELGELAEARSAYRRAIALENEGSFETNAGRFLSALRGDE